MPQPSITEFLLARVAEREQDADSIHCDDCPAMDYDYGGMPTGPCRCGEPERVVAECAATRAIIALHCEGVDGECRECKRAVPCPTLQIVARIDAGRADFDQSWAA
jgi:hypothetical protein